MTEEIDAGSELVREFDNYRPVKVAFRLKAGDDEGLRFLSIASDSLEGANIRLGYREVIRLAKEMRNPDLDPFRVKLIHAESPLARAAVGYSARFPGGRGAHLGGTVFGGRTFDDAYIDPSPLTVAAC